MFRKYIILTFIATIVIGLACSASAEDKPQLNTIESAADDISEISSGDSLDWPRWRGKNADSIVDQTNWNPYALTEQPKILWQAEVGTGYSSVAVTGRYKLRANCLDLFICV